MKKLYDKDPVWFAVIWILVYVLAFGNADSLSEAMGVPKLLTVAVGLVLALILWHFLRKNNLETAQGLCPFRGKYRRFLYFLPLIAISSVNFWFGTAVTASPLETLLYILSMCLVGFLEEVIFRGLLFQAMRPSGVTAAIVVSSLTFGAGHIINLLLGAPLAETLLQLVYASAVGFCYTAVFLAGGSLLPCILSHIFVNSTSIFATEHTNGQMLLAAILQTLLGIGYGLWLLKRKPA